MYVCLCHGITDRRLREAADAGARDLDTLAAMTGCGTGCGCCRETAERLLAEHREARAFDLPLLQAA